MVAAKTCVRACYLFLCLPLLHGFMPRPRARAIAINGPRRHDRRHGCPAMRLSESEDLFDRRALVPAAFTFASGVALLASSYNDNQVYEAKHKELFALLQGPEILEVGIGGAANLDYYRRGVRVTGIDPNVGDFGVVGAKAKARARDIELSIIKGEAESLPFADSTFDSVVSTLVFCSVRDPKAALSEVARVLKPGGSFLFFDHIVAPEGTFLRAQQDLLEPLQELLADGCHLNRQTDELYKRSVGGGSPVGFSKLERLEYLEQPSKWLIARQIAGILIK